MEIDPVVASLAGAIVTLAGVIFRLQTQRAERAEREAAEWRERYMGFAGIADFAIDQAERKAGRKR